jgi:pimeloyl-ACP methyl ester carboxylesterase
MSTVRSQDGTTIAFSRAGDGPPLVLVDGALSHRTFGPLKSLPDLLAPHFAVHSYDRRGRGESGNTAPYTVAREVEDLAAVIESAGGEAAVFGMSSGAVLALEAAASGLPITRLVLYEPPFSVDPQDVEENRRYMRRLDQLIVAGRRGDAIEHFLVNSGVPADALAAMRREANWPRFEEVAPTLPYDHAIVGDGLVPRERAAKIAVPTVVANGADSPDVFREAARATVDAIPGARHRSLAGQSWGRVQPEALAAMLEDVLVT